MYGLHERLLGWSSQYILEYGLDLWSDSHQGQAIIFSKTSGPILGPTQFLVQ